MGNRLNIKTKQSKRSVGKVDSPLNDILQNVEWGKYRLGDLFEFEAIKQAKSQSIIPTDESDNGVPYIVQSMFNNMFSRKVNKQWLIDNNEAPVSGNRIVLGVTLPAVSYQPIEFGASQVITAKSDWLNQKNGLFITIAISKLMNKFSYNSKPGLQIYKDLVIQLPTKKRRIDFDLMESFIEEFESEMKKLVQAYLSENNLCDNDLTKNERLVLNNFNQIVWGTFNVEKIFGKATRGRRLKSSDRISGDLPFVTAGETDEGVSDFIGNNVVVFSKNTTTIDMFGSAKYRNYKYGADDHVSIINTENLSKNASVFVTSAIHKSSYNGQFNYGRNFYPKDADLLNISLPVKNNKPDFELMETIISAINKIVIKDIVFLVEKG